MAWFTITETEEIQNIWRINAKSKKEALEKMRARMDKPTKSYHFGAKGTLVEQDRPKLGR